MMTDVNQRSYEVSIWTLQDSFITVLKPTNLEFKGQIQDPDMNLKNDGTLVFSFSIPMYLRTDKQTVIENPIWYTTRNGVLAASMRKLKVIFNKKQENEAVFEFIITKVTESHDRGQLMCKVESESLAFHELGHHGVTISLDGDDYVADVAAAEESKETNTLRWQDATQAGPIAHFNVTSYTVINNRLNLVLVPTADRDVGADASNRNWGFALDGKPISSGPWEGNRPVHGYDFTVDLIENLGFRVSIGSAMFDTNASTLTIRLSPGGVVNPYSGNIIDIKFWKGAPEAPLNNLQYWTEKALVYSDWKYIIQMDWASYDGVIVDGYADMNLIDRDTLNAEREANGLRRCDTVYEDEYIPSWKVTEDGSALEADGDPVLFKEKCRQVSISESNIYNITQTLAEEFGVFCKYKYIYDVDYHIIDKYIIYYNNFINEASGVKDVTYPYDTDKISRTMDGTDICTKLYVKSVDDDTAPTGMISIMSTAANPSGEDYILNFDYLHEIGTITDEQYAAIRPYEVKMHELNRKIDELNEIIAKAQIDEQEYLATITLTENSIAQATDRILENDRLLASVTKDTGYIHLTKGTALHATLIPDKDVQDLKKYKINLTTKGVVDGQTVEYKDANGNVITSTGVAKIKIFKAASDILPGTFSYVDGEGQAADSYTTIDKDNKLTFKYDENDNIIGITGFDLDDGTSTTRYLVLSYSPKLWYENVKKKFEARKKADEDANAEAKKNLEITQKLLKEKTELRQKLIDEKTSEIRKFNIMMGPALREGIWNPEDYTDYGTKGQALIQCGDWLNGLTVEQQDTTDMVSFLWDTEPFDDEQLAYQSVGVDMKKEHYPYVLLDKAKLDLIRDNNLFTKLCLFYNATEIDDTQQFLRLGGTMKLAFRQHTDNKMYPVLLLTGMSVDTINTIRKGTVSLGIYSIETVPVSAEQTSLYSSTLKMVPEILYDYGNTDVNQIIYKPDENYSNIYYPRIEIKSLSLKANSDCLKVRGTANAFDFKIIKVAARHNLDKVFVTPTIDSLNNHKNIKFLIKWIHHDKNGNEHAWWATDIKDLVNGRPYMYTWDKLAANYEIGLRFDDNNYKLMRRSFDMEISAYSGVNGEYMNPGEGTLLATHSVRIDLMKDENSRFLFTDTLDDDLQMYFDYSVLVRDNSYFLTLTPELFVRTYFDRFTVDYEISNADTSIYLDAREVSRTNAYPQVSYDVSLSLFGRKINFETYNLLGQLININDNDLKFYNVQGYISEVDLKLDKPWEDSIKVQNYKNKFEDLFSTIIASSNIVQANAAIYDRTVALFNSDGTLKQDVIQTTLNKVDLQYAFNKGKLTIDENRGIWAESDDGVVAFSGGGIFTATEKDGSGNWVWHTGILPSGINASLINAGQLDTNLVRIFAGDNLRFQMNEQGLFAYRAKLDGSPMLDEYVVHNSEGLFLRKPQSTNPNNLIDRVAIDWAGLTLHNNAGDRTFFADAECGDLWLSGTVSAESFKIVDTDEEWEEGVTEGSSLDYYMATLLAKQGSTLRQSFSYLFEQAGNVLQASEASLSALNDLNIESGSLMSDFYEKVKSGIMEHREIKLYSDSSVELITGDTTSGVSAISISPSKGVWIGSSKEIRFYSGNITNTTTASAASSLINSERILFGVSDGSSGSAVDITKDSIVLGSGKTAVENIVNGSIEASNNTTGVKITKDGIYMATRNNAGDRNYIGMDSGGIQIGAIGSNATGSFIKLSKDQFAIGSGTDLAINTNNVQIFTDGNHDNYFVLGNNLLNGGTRLMTLTNSGLTVTGKIQATSGYIGSEENGWTINTSSISHGTIAAPSTSQGNIYIGTEGININNVTKMYANGGFTMFSTPGGSQRLLDLQQDTTGGYTLTIAPDVFASLFTESGLSPEFGGTGCKSLDELKAQLSPYYTALNTVNNLPQNVDNGSVGVVYCNQQSSSIAILTNTSISLIITPLRANASTIDLSGVRYTYNYSKVLTTEYAGVHYDPWSDNRATSYGRIGYGVNSDYRSLVDVKCTLTINGTGLTALSGTFQYCGMPPQLEDGNGDNWASYYIVNDGVGTQNVSGTCYLALYTDNNGNLGNCISNVISYIPNCSGHSTALLTKSFNLTTTQALVNGNTYHLVFYSNNKNSIHFLKKGTITLTSSGSVSTIVAELYIRSANQWIKVAP